MIKRGMAVALSVSLLAGAMSVSSSLPTAAASTKRVEVGTKGNVTINLDGREVWQAAADAMQKLLRPIHRLAGILQIPYILWLMFAAYLNFGIWFLNR